MRGTATMYKVPPGTKPTKCKGPTCGKSFYWVRTERGINVPVDCSGEGMQHPSAAKDGSQFDVFSGATLVQEGFGVSHHHLCPDTGSFRHE